MAILPIPGQPVNMGGIPEQMCAPGNYCTVKKTSDDLWVQMRQTPCGASLACNPDFGYGDVFLDEDFLTDPTLSGWVFAGTNSWDGSLKALRHDPGALATATYSAGTLVNGAIYIVTFVAATTTTGTVQISLGGGAAGALINADVVATSYTQYITAGAANDNLVISIGGNLVLVDDILITPAPFCWTPGTNWRFIEGAAKHSPGAAGDLTESIYSGYSANDYFVVTFSVYGMTGGSLVVKVGGTTAGTVTQNGSYTYYVISALSDNLLKFSADSDFDGTLILESTYNLFNHDDLIGKIIITDLDGDYITSPYFFLAEDRINVLVFTDVPHNECVLLKAIDPCIGVSGGEELVTDPEFDSPGTWTVVGATWGISAGKFQQTTNMAANDGSAVRPFVHQSGTHALQITVTTGNWQSTGGSQFINVVLNSPSLANLGMFTIPFPLPNTTYTYSTLFNFDNPGYSTYDKIGVEVENLDFSGSESNQILFLSVKKVSAETAQAGLLISNCISNQEDVTGLRLIRGVADEIHSHGFVFIPPFSSLQTRIELSFTNPHHPDKTDGYLYSTSRKKRKYAQADSAWDVVLGPCDQAMHRCLNTILLMDQLYIAPLSDDVVQEYHFEDKEYHADWDKNNLTGLAESVVEISRVDGTTFNSNE